MTITVTSSAPFSDATNANVPLLIVNEAGPSHSGGANTQLVCTAPNNNCPVTALTPGTEAFDGTPGRPNIFVPTARSANTLTFANIPYVVPPSGYAMKYRLTGARLNIASQNVSSFAAVIFTVANSGAAPLSIAPDLSTVAFLQPSPLVPSVRLPDNSGPSGGWSINRSASGPQRAGVLRFGENVPESRLLFKVRQALPSLPLSNLDTTPSTIAMNTAGTVFDGMESGFYNPALVHPNVDFTKNGLADSGTRLRAVINGIPAGADVYVPLYRVLVGSSGLTVVTSLSSGVPFRLVQSEIGAFSPVSATTTIEGIPAARLTVSGGSAAAYWEPLYGEAQDNQNVDFPVWVAPNGSTDASTATVKLDIGPVTNDSARVPRFVASGAAPMSLFRLSAPPAATPVPPSILLTLIGGAGIAAHQLRRRKRQAERPHSN